MAMIIIDNWVDNLYKSTFTHIDFVRKQQILSCDKAEFIGDTSKKLYSK